MTVWNYILIGPGLGLLVFLLWKELRRSNRAYLSARMIATVLAVGALVCMGLPMRCQRGASTGSGREGVLPTEGGNADKEGVVSVDWQRRLVKGEQLQVQGHWKGRAARLFLEGMGQVLDSVIVREDSFFVLHTVPAQAGRAVYRFIAVAGKDTLEREKIPVEVIAGKPLNILLLASSPAAENTFLMNWLGAGGHRVASRTLVSKDKYQQVFANRAAMPLGQVTAALLGEFDIVIADALTVSGGLWPMLQRQAALKGLGLVIQLDSAGGAALKSRPGMRVLMRDSAGRVEVGVVREGAGEVVYTNQTTFPMLLAGEQERYAAFWSSVLRKEEEGPEWGLEPTLPRVREPVRLSVQTEGAGIPQGVVGQVNVYLAEDGVLPFKWSGVYWPTTAGWQTVRLLQGDTAWWYAWGAEAWMPIRHEVKGRESSGREQWVAVSKGWFCALFLVSLVFLWIEKKIL